MGTLPPGSCCLPTHVLSPVPTEEALQTHSNSEEALRQEEGAQLRRQSSGLSELLHHSWQASIPSPADFARQQFAQAHQGCYTHKEMQAFSQSTGCGKPQRLIPLRILTLSGLLSARRPWSKVNQLHLGQCSGCGWRRGVHDGGARAALCIHKPDASQWAGLGRRRRSGGSGTAGQLPPVVREERQHLLIGAL